MTVSSSVVKYPASILRKKGKVLKNITEEHREMFNSMIDVMHKNNGIGLAAQQVGIDLQVAVVDAGEGTIKMANPKIVEKKSNDTMEEGCLSIPSRIVKVKRAKTITLEYTDELGNLVKKTFSGLTAKAIQHEVDHLNGRLIIDYLPWYKRMWPC